MRVVGGIARGRPLTAPKGTRTRPTSDFVREAVFNVLGSHLDLQGSSVLDLYAGTGALGIEALSRGAARAVFVDHDRHAVAAVRANLASTGLAGGEVHQAEARRWLLDRGASEAEFDVAFVDPPYAFDGWSDVLDRLRATVAVLESDREVEPGDRWQVLKTKHYGTTVVTLTSPRSTP